MDTRDIEIAFEAPEPVRDALQNLGRTEALRFSPNQRRLALAGIARNSVAIVDVEIAQNGERPHVTVTDVVELTAPGLEYPHGVDFLDDDELLVAARRGPPAVLRLPPSAGASDGAEVQPLDAARDLGFELLRGPNALAITSGADGDREVLIGHRNANVITRHVLRHGDSGALTVTANEALLRRGIAIVDSVALSPDGAWLALSNSSHHNVHVYDRSASLDERSEPHCILRGASYPHGVCFSPDGRHLFVSDAARPFVHLHTRRGDRWSGVHYPAASLQVMDDETFLRGRINSREGGPKGIDIDGGGRVIAVTSAFQPLAFFDATAILEGSTAHDRVDAQHVSLELEITRSAEERFDERVAAIEASRAYRMAVHLRRAKASWSRLWR